jgi:putative transposase
LQLESQARNAPVLRGALFRRSCDFIAASIDEKLGDLCPYFLQMTGALRERIRTIIQEVCKELGVEIVSGVLSREHVHMFVEIPPHLAVSDFVRCVKGRSSHRVQMEFPDLRKRYWGRHFWARGYFSTTSGNITDDVILQYLQEHEPTGASR